jgi:glucuronoarabinoxylan endo-1,4-beta-xylanase
MLFTIFTACDKADEKNAFNNNKNNPPKQDTLTTSLQIASDSSFQIIDGFGGANRMWGNQFLKPAISQKTFGTGNDDLGLSIFRVRIASDTNEWPLILESVKEAHRFKVKILACPWSPPAGLKSNKNQNGGYLLPENYGAFKDHINAFIRFMARNGISIYSISIQNEPDIKVSYESCDWTEADIINFLKNFGHQIENSLVAAPESFNFNRNFTNSVLLNEESGKNTDIIAGHIYGSGLGTIPVAEEYKKPIWMTEYLLNLNTGNAGAAPWSLYSETTKFDETLEMLRTIHLSMKSNWNAYIWWYLQRYYSFIGDGEQGTISDSVLKRGWAFSHYSKFIRPGYKRTGLSTPNTNGLLATAYNGEGKNVIVIINPGEKVQKMNITFNQTSSVEAFETNVFKNREKINLKLNQNKAEMIINPKSVITVVSIK